MIDENNEYGFTGVFIPADIYLRDDVSWKEKILWCDIQGLSKDGYCSASNEWFAEKFKTTPEKISAMVSKLKKLGLVEQVGFDGRVRKLRVCFEEKDKAGLSKKIRQGYQKREGTILYDEYSKNNRVSVEENDPTTTSPFDRFVDWWNGELIPVEDNINGNVVKIQVKSQKRKQMFKARWNDTKVYMRNRGMAVDDESVFVYMTDEVIGGNYVNSDWMRGKVKGNGYETGYRVEFDNIFTPKMWTGLLEKKYYNRSLDKVKYDS